MKANSLFEKLGYRAFKSLKRKNEIICEYKKNNVFISIEIKNNTKKVIKYCKNLFYIKAEYISNEELEAIVQQFKEMKGE